MPLASVNSVFRYSSFKNDRFISSRVLTETIHVRVPMTLCEGTDSFDNQTEIPIEDTVQAFNSCTKSAGRPGIIYDRMPDWVPSFSGYGCDCWLLTLELNVAWIHSFVVH